MGGVLFWWGVMRAAVVELKALGVRLIRSAQLTTACSMATPPTLIATLLQLRLHVFCNVLILTLVIVRRLYLAYLYAARHEVDVGLLYPCNVNLGT